MLKLTNQVWGVVQFEHVELSMWTWQSLLLSSLRRCDPLEETPTRNSCRKSVRNTPPWKKTKR